jgi:hypothetical protein
VSGTRWNNRFPTIARHIHAAVASNKEYETRLENENDKRSWILHATPCLQINDSGNGAVITVLDITLQLQEEEAQREREVLYRVAFELSGVSMALVEAPNGNFLKAYPPIAAAQARRAPGTP